MNVQIPIAGLTLVDNQTYDGQLPVWATRPLMVNVTTGTNEPINITVREGGAIRKEISLPYQQYGTDVDLSFAAPLLSRADRNSSDGTPGFPQQLIEFWSTDIMTRIIIPVFHCDETYWDTLGNDSALPQPPKPHIPNQTLDIYFPYSIHPSDAFQVEVEPVTGAPSDAIFPTTYVLGNTIDIKYVKKLTIKNVWGSGLDQVINYEDKLYTDVIYDESLQCALRARWNMRNGQWFWAAFKDYFWSNKFTPIRGRGGVTEQAEITINLEYGEEYYNVYQELLVSSNVVFELNLPGINQYQSKRFRAEVSGDTGARWSNSTKTYRQQVRFRTTELQDNYMFPQQPDQPPTPSIAFSAQFNPWTVGAAYAEGLVNSIYSNAAWEVQSEPNWLTVTNSTTLLTPDMFEQGRVEYTPGMTWDQAKISTPVLLRLKKPFENLNNEVHSIISGISGYSVLFVYLDSDGKIVSKSSLKPINGRVNTAQGAQIGLILRRVDGSPFIPADITTLNAYWGKRYVEFPAGTSNLTATVAANNGDARTGNIVLKSRAGSTTYTIPITQQKASISLSPAYLQISNGQAIGRLITQVTANTSWDLISKPSWLDVQPTIGDAGTTDIFANIQANTGEVRNGSATFRSRLNTSVTATMFFAQAGSTGNITATPSTIEAGYVHLPVTVALTSFGTWSISQRDPWITPSQYDGPSGTTNVTLTIADNTASNNPRTGTITFYNQLTQQIAVVTVSQAGVPSSIGMTPFKITAPKTAGTTRVVVVVSANNWVLDGAPGWVAISPASGAAGSATITVTYNTANNIGSKRSGYLKMVNTTTNEIAICIIEQEG